MDQFRGLIEWCAGEADVVRPRVVSALVYRYEGARALGAWNGFLTYASDRVARFDGRLPSIGPDPLDRDALDVSIRVTIDAATAFVAGAQLPLVDVTLRNGVLEARCETDRQGRRLACFLQSGRRPRTRGAQPPTFQAASRLS
jgi:hypothetical protein